MSLNRIDFEKIIQTLQQTVKSHLKSHSYQIMFGRKTTNCTEKKKKTNEKPID